MSATVIDVELLPPSGEHRREDLQKDVSELPKVPAPMYRHAVPSAPWPWMDFDADAREVHPLPPGGLGQDPEWSYYPQSLFRNWTHDQVERCGILKFTNSKICSVHKVDVFNDGTFDKSDEDRTVEVENSRAYWNCLETAPPPNIRVRALFVENMTVPVLQILGTKYNIEPSFFASSANWIPSRYKANPKHDEDHITVVLPFIHIMKNQKLIVRTRPVRTATLPFGRFETLEELPPYKDEEQIIDTQAPLLLPGDKILFQDLLAIHIYRTSTTSTIISYHPSTELQGTSAKRLQSLVQRTGDNVHWSKIFRRSKDPTFLFLAILWYALYAWGEAFEVLYRYINALESDVKINDIKLTRELHKLQAHLLYYQQLLQDFRASVEFVRDTPNPAMSVLACTQEERDASKELLVKEAGNLVSEIDRLSIQRSMLSDRLANVIHLAFAIVNIVDSKAVQTLAATTMIDSAAVKQIAHLTMIFFPATFLANIFRMKIREFNHATTGTLAHYVETAVGLTLSTWWLAIALQQESAFFPPGCGVLQRSLWPLFYVYDLTSAATRKWYERANWHEPTPKIPAPQAMLYFVFEETREDCDST